MTSIQATKRSFDKLQEIFDTTFAVAKEAVHDPDQRAHVLNDVSQALLQAREHAVDLEKKIAHWSKTDLRWWRFMRAEKKRNLLRCQQMEKLILEFTAEDVQVSVAPSAVPGSPEIDSAP
jgi:hypothetical protein